MRNSLFTLALLASACTLPLSAHADTIDDFVLIGNGTTTTFSLPASPPGNSLTCPTGIIESCLPGSETFFSVSTMVTTDGISSEEGISFPTSLFGGGMTIGPPIEQFLGPQLFEPNAADPTFLTGTFTLGPLFVTSPVPLSATPPLRITPGSLAATPEPPSLFLFTTGGLGLLLLSIPKTALTR